LHGCTDIGKTKRGERPQRDSNPLNTPSGDLHFAYLRAKRPKIRPKIPPAIPPQRATVTAGRKSVPRPYQPPVR